MKIGPVRRPALRSIRGALVVAAAVAGCHATAADSKPVLPIRAAAAAGALSVTAAAGPTQVDTGKSVAFGARASGGVGGNQYAWTFGDGTSGQGSTTTHVYGQTGSFVATCQVTDAAGSSASASVRINVGVGDRCPSGATCEPPPEIQVWDPCGRLLYSPDRRYQGLPGLDYLFTTAPSTLVTWSFGDGTGRVDAPSAGHSFSRPGSYLVTATDIELRTVAVIIDIGGLGESALGALSVTASPSSPTAGGAVSLSAQPGDPSLAWSTFTWNFGDGGARSGGATVEHSFAKPGAYEVQCLAATSGGAFAAGSATVEVKSAPRDPRMVLAVPAVFFDLPDGSTRRTDITFFNPDPNARMVLSLAVVDGTTSLRSAADLSWRGPIYLQPASTVFLPGFLESLLRLPRGFSGILLMRVEIPDDVAPVVAARVVDVRPGGTVYGAGYAVPVFTLPEGRAGGTPAKTSVCGLAEDSASRSTITLFNPTPEAADVAVRLFDGKGAVLGRSLSIALGPYGYRELGDVAAAFGWSPTLQPATALRVETERLTAEAVLSWGSVSALPSGDVSFVAANLAPTPTRRLPAVVHSPGKSSSSWRSDVTLANSTAFRRSLDVTYRFERTSGGRASVRKPVRLGPGETLEWKDFVASWLELKTDDGDGYFNAVLDVAPAPDDPAPEAGIDLQGRTYNVSATGSLGTDVPSFAPNAGIAQGRAPGRLALTGLRSDAGYRSSVLVFLPGASAADGASARVTVFSADGKTSVTRRVTLGGDVQVVQLSVGELLGQIPQPWTSITAIVDDVAGAAPVAACGTVVDEKSGDSTLVTAFPLN